MVAHGKVGEAHVKAGMVAHDEALLGNIAHGELGEDVLIKIHARIDVQWRISMAF